MPIEQNLRAQIETYLSQLDALIRRGRQVRDSLEANPSNGAAIASTRAWQEDCGVTINQLSGGSKAHWLARSFSEAFLMRSSSGLAAEGAAPAQIVERLIGVLVQAVASLTGMDDSPGASGHSSQLTDLPAPRRFEFVHNPELRPVVERAYAESRHAFEQRDYKLALNTSCGILEAIVTDALEHKGLSSLAASCPSLGQIDERDLAAEKIASWSFETRLARAEKAGLIRGGCARLPPVARAYRDHADPNGEHSPNAPVSERDAQRAAQVLRVVMRDL